MTTVHVHRVVAAVFAWASLGVAMTVPALGAAKEVPREKQCLAQLIEGTDPMIDCIHLAWLTEAERGDLEKLTRGYLKNARCEVAVKIERRAVEEAVAADDHVFTSPAQPVTCDVSTSRGDYKITGTFSPRIVFKDGLAVEGSPGLANIEGVNGYLAWPVVHYINFSERITKPMLLMINAYRTYRAPKK